MPYESFKRRQPILLARQAREDAILNRQQGGKTEPADRKKLLSKSPEAHIAQLYHALLGEKESRIGSISGKWALQIGDIISAETGMSEKAARDIENQLTLSRFTTKEELYTAFRNVLVQEISQFAN